jgi:hypothetical protein
VALDGPDQKLGDVDDLQRAAPAFFFSLIASPSMTRQNGQAVET